jgi:hypothetical protein
MFDSARLKVERAEKHIGDLKIAFDRFIETHPHTLCIDNDPQTGAQTVQVRFSETPPANLSLILGDAIHNLRSALDHATWELIGIDGGTQDRKLAFPFSSDQWEYESACQRIKTPLDDTKKFLIALAAYPGGAGEKLYDLKRFDNADKHSVMTPVIGVTRIGHIKVTDPNGTTFMEMAGCTFSVGPDGRAGVGRWGPGCSIEIDQDADVTIDVFIHDSKFFKALPLIETCMNLSHSVQDVIGQFEELVRTRK